MPWTQRPVRGSRRSIGDVRSSETPAGRVPRIADRYRPGTSHALTEPMQRRFPDMGASPFVSTEQKADSGQGLGRRKLCATLVANRALAQGLPLSQHGNRNPNKILTWSCSVCDRPRADVHPAAEVAYSRSPAATCRRSTTLPRPSRSCTLAGRSVARSICPGASVVAASASVMAASAAQPSMGCACGRDAAFAAARWRCVASGRSAAGRPGRPGRPVVMSSLPKGVTGSLTFGQSRFGAWRGFRGPVRPSVRSSAVCGRRSALS